MPHSMDYVDNKNRLNDRSGEARQECESRDSRQCVVGSSMKQEHIDTRQRIQCPSCLYLQMRVVSIRLSNLAHSMSQHVTYRLSKWTPISDNELLAQSPVPPLLHRPPACLKVKTKIIVNIAEWNNLGYCCPDSLLKHQNLVMLG